MSRIISNVVDIGPDQRKSWTVLVQVLENGHVQETRAKKKFKRLVFTDSQGTKLTALIYDYHLRYFTTLLTQYKRYYISNAGVIENEPKYRISSYPYSWILNNKTPVEEFVDSVPMTLTCQFEFTDFCDLHKFAEKETLLNVKAIVLCCFPMKEQGPGFASKRDIVIVNQEKKLMLLTLWAPFDEKEGEALANMVSSAPIIFGMRLRVTTFNCLSLTTRTTSGLMINPPVMEDLQMREWYNTNKKELDQLLQMKTYKDTSLLLPYPKDTDIASVATIVSSFRTFKASWIRGKTTLSAQQRSFWYTACANCHKTLDADLTWVVTCPSCRLESEVEAISRLTIDISDGTSSISATIFTPEAEKLMQFTAVQLKEADENSLDLHKDIAESIQDQTIVAFIRSYEATFQSKTELKVNVLKAYTSSDVFSDTNLLTHPPQQASNISNPAALVQASGSNIEVPTPATSEEKQQLHSQSVKLIGTKAKSNISSKPAKRSLTFSDQHPTCKTSTVPSKPCDTVADESASKKNKDLISIKKEIGAHSGDGNPTKKTKDY